jgi:hypothetical protein
MRQFPLRCTKPAFEISLAQRTLARVKVYLHQAAIHLRVAAAKAAAAEERAHRDLGRLFVFAPFPFHAPLQTSPHPIADAAGNALAQFGFRMQDGIEPVLARFTPL